MMRNEQLLPWPAALKLEQCNHTFLTALTRKTTKYLRQGVKCVNSQGP